MANQPRADNPVRSIRVDDELWEATQHMAELLGQNVSEVVRRALRAYVAPHPNDPGCLLCDRRPSWGGFCDRH